MSGGGGGGAGAVGQNSPNQDKGGDGGIGVVCNILSSSNANTRSVGEVDGSDVYYGGGGGGSIASNSTQTAGDGGKGGGGNGYRPTSDPDHDSYENGAANTGGGAGATDGAGTTGGSGVVILKYPNTKTISVGAGLTSTTDTEGSNKITTFTAGTGNVSWA